jgi:hypothetical protein
MKRYFLLLVFLFPKGVFALFEWRNVGAEALGFAEGYTAIARGVESIPFNPAGLAGSAFQVQATYTPLYGGLNVGLRSADLSLALPTPYFNLGIRAQDVSADLGKESGGSHREETFTLALARYISESARIGVNFNLYHLQFPDPFGSATTLGVDVGFLADLYRRWRFGFFVENLNGAYFSTEGGREPLPRALGVAVAFTPTPLATTTVDIRKEPNFPARLVFAQEIRLIQDRFSVRGGVLKEGERFRWSLGASFYLSTISLNYSATFDPNLPLTHSIGLSYGR